MKNFGDKIKFDSRSEVLSILLALEKWLVEHGKERKNFETQQDVKRLVCFLDDCKRSIITRQ